MDELKQDDVAVNDGTQQEVVSEEKESRPVSPWKSVGLDRYDGLPVEQIAKEVSFQFKTAGKHASEIGQLRKDLQERDRKLQDLERVIGTKQAAKVDDAVEDMDEIQLQQFYALIEKNPRKAIRFALGDNFGKPNFEDEKFQEVVDNRVREALKQYHGYIEESSAMSDPDYERFAEYIETLKSPENLGETRSPKEMLSLSKLVVENKPLADLTYMNLKKYPQMPFEECKKFANLTLNASSQADKAKTSLTNQIKNLQNAAPGGGVSKTSEKPNIKTMDEAFAADE